MSYLKFSSETASQIVYKALVDAIKTPNLVNPSHLKSILNSFYTKLLNPFNYQVSF